jgi:hypothetical protein
MGKVLVSWIGHTDLRALKEQEKVGLGPVAQAVTDRSFDEVVLLNNYPKDQVSDYVTWLKPKTQARVFLHAISLSGPTQFGEIYEATVRVVSDVRKRLGEGSQLTFHLFGSSKAHQALRKMLVDENQLEGIISLPSGVFRPYAGVSTAIIVFTKGGKTDHAFFYDLQDDGFSLDDKRTQLYPDTYAGDLPDVLARWQKRDPKKDTDRTKKHFFVTADQIRGEKYDLSINLYKETVYEEEQYDPPREILDRMMALEKEIMGDMEELRGMLGSGK